MNQTPNPRRAPLVGFLLVALTLLAAVFGVNLMTAGAASATVPEITAEQTPGCGPRTTLRVIVDARYGETAHVEVYQSGPTGFLGRPAGGRYDQAAGTTSAPLSLTWPSAGSFTVGVNLRFDHREGSDRTFPVTVTAGQCTTTTVAPTTSTTKAPATTTTVAPTTSTSAAPTTSTTVAPTTSTTKAPTSSTTRPATTTTAAPATTTTVEPTTTTTAAPIITGTPATPVTPPTTAGAEVKGKVEGIAEQITNPALTGQRLPSTGASGTSILLRWAAALTVAGALLVLSIRRSRRRATVRA